MIVEGIKEAEKLLKESYYKERILTEDNFYGLEMNGGFFLVQVEVTEGRKVKPSTYLESPLIIFPYENLTVSKKEKITVKIENGILAIGEKFFELACPYYFEADYPGLLLRRGLKFIPKGELVIAPSFYLGLRNGKQLVIIPPIKKDEMRWEIRR